eukprot:Rmarinus@m.8400
MFDLGLPSFFTLLVYASGYLAFAFGVLCLACGLYYLAELIEEYTALTKKILTYTIYSLFGVHLLLWLWEGFPIQFVLVGIIAHAAYCSLLKTFPHFQWASVEFVSSVAMAIVNHMSWFYFFTHDDSRYYTHRIATLSAFFFSCVWLVPFMFFLSISANEQVLPTQGSGSSISQTGSHLTDHKPLKRTNYLLNLFGWVRDKKDEFIPAVVPSASKGA